MSDPQNANAPDRERDREAANPGAAGSGRDAGDRAVEPTPVYSWYVLAMLSIVYLLNFLDRQILSILAESIKEDLGVSDAQLGFLYGTAFAIFYAVFGIPLARLADVWVRKNVISLGLAVWSAMTALSGTARSFFSLGAYRIGVGIGEASATPAAYSMLSDAFPPRLRATAFALYAAGLYVGQGIGFYLGGWILDTWSTSFPDGVGWLGLHGWQAAFFAVGLPGLVIAIWMWTLREPARGQWEGDVAPPIEERPLRLLLTEFAAVVPPLTLWSLKRAGAPASLLAWNVGIGAGIAAVAWALIANLGGPEQWVALGIGLYAAFSWVQGASLRDRTAFVLLFRCSSLQRLGGAVALTSFVTYSFMFWTAPFLLRTHGVSTTEVGFYLMLASAVGGGLGVAGGGFLSDHWRQRMVVGRVYVVILSVVLMIPAALGMLYAESSRTAFAMAFVYQAVSTMWVGSATALVTELVLPRMRAIATAVLLMLYTFVGLALGPFAVGRLSDAIKAGGAASEDSLRTALAVALLVLVPALGLAVASLRTVPDDENSLAQRAREAEAGVL